MVQRQVVLDGYTGVLHSPVLFHFNDAAFLAVTWEVYCTVKKHSYDSVRIFY